MKLTNGFEYSTIEDLFQFFEKTDNAYEFKIKINPNDLYKCVKNSCMINYTNFNNVFVFDTFKNIKIKVVFYFLNCFYIIERKDAFNRTITIMFEFKKENFILKAKRFMCNKVMHNLNGPALIIYNNEKKIIKQYYYFYGSHIRKSTLEKKIETFNNFNIKNVKRCKLKKLIELDNIAMDFNNIELRNALKEEIKLKLLIEKLEGGTSSV